VWKSLAPGWTVVCRIGGLGTADTEIEVTNIMTPRDTFLGLKAPGHWRALLRNLTVECLALQPSWIKLWEYRHLQRYLLAGLFRLEKNRVVVTGAGPAGHRYRMRLSWQGHTECVLGIYEPSVVRGLQKYLRVGDTCFDVGAHVGYLTILMARLVGPGGLAVAFEPVPETFETLGENVRLNHLDNVKLERTAVGEREGMISLFCDATQKLSWTPSVSAYSAPSNHLKRISAPVLSLDGYLQKSALRPRLVKIDVEGAELAVLRGARKMLLDARPVVLVEIHDLGAGYRAEVMQFLDACGYVIEETSTRGRETFCLAVPCAASTSARGASAQFKQRDEACVV
jgi:FkbM family methyltransferase